MAKKPKFMADFDDEDYKAIISSIDLALPLLEEYAEKHTAALTAKMKIVPFEAYKEPKIRKELNYRIVNIYTIFYKVMVKDLDYARNEFGSDTGKGFEYLMNCKDTEIYDNKIHNRNLNTIPKELDEMYAKYSKIRDATVAVNFIGIRYHKEISAVGCKAIMHQCRICPKTMEADLSKGVKLGQYVEIIKYM